MSYNLGSPMKNAFAHAATQGGIVLAVAGGLSLLTGNYSMILPAVMFSALGAYNTAARYESANAKKAKKAAAENNSRPSEGPGW